MHRVIQDHLEEVLAGLNPQAAAHLSECEECREEVSVMRSHAAMLQSFRAEELTPRPGFYARVMDRIEARKPIDIFQLFFESAFGRRIAMASMSLAFLFSIYLVSSERLDQQPVTVAGESQTMVSDSGLPDKDTVLVNLVTYRER